MPNGAAEKWANTLYSLKQTGFVDFFCIYWCSGKWYFNVCSKVRNIKGTGNVLNKNVDTSIIWVTLVTTTKIGIFHLFGGIKCRNTICKKHISNQLDIWSLPMVSCEFLVRFDYVRNVHKFTSSNPVPSYYVF